MLLSRDTLFRVVCEFINPNSKNCSIGTGTFVSTPVEAGKNRGWIVTASHVAKQTTLLSRIVIATEGGKSIKIPLAVFGSIRDWKHHKEADISVLPIIFADINKDYVYNRFLPYSHFNLEHRVVSRDIELTSIGFPNGLGTEEDFLPFTFRSYAASGFVRIPRADTNTMSEFFFLENPSMGGYSGGPVVDLGHSSNGILKTIRGQTCCHGIIHGTIQDNTGGKFAMVTPAYYLKELIEMELNSITNDE